MADYRYWGAARGGFHLCAEKGDSCPGLPGTEGFPGCSIFSAKSREILDELDRSSPDLADNWSLSC